ncbi:MAG: hypothetical protein LAN64_02595, partial [Acidobacteriia bacterium]|nr:hypothetical protein [Terriglobia bacterium]
VVLRFINLLSAALIAGGQVFVLMVILPVMRRWSPAMAVQTHQAMLFQTPDKFIVPSAVVCPLSAIAILALRHKADVSGLFDVVGVLAAAAVTLTSVVLAEPLSRTIAGWTEGVVPGGFAELQQRYDSVHAVRTAAALLMTAAFIVATLTV